MATDGQANPYAAGANVYNSGSSAATSGPVDPMGYIDRSLNNTPNPGTPAYTPGVAAAALNTLRSNDPANTKAQSILNPLPAPATTPTQSTTTGAIGYNLPVDYDLKQNAIDAGSMYQTTQSTDTAARQAAAQGYIVGDKALQDGEVNQQRSDINGYAAKGMARSSGYLGQIDKTANNYNLQFADLSNKFFAALNGADVNDANAQKTYDQTMENIRATATGRLADRQTSNPDSGAIAPADPAATTDASGSSSSISEAPQGGAPGIRQPPTPVVTPLSAHQLHVLRQPSAANKAEYDTIYKTLTTHQKNILAHLSKYSPAEIKAAGF